MVAQNEARIRKLNWQRQKPRKLIYAQAEEKEIAASYFPIEEPQAEISADPVEAPSAIERDMKEDKVAPIANVIVSENLPE